MKRVVLLAIALMGCGYADSFQTVNDGPVHEAYITRETGALLNQAIVPAPPQKITELTPRQVDAEAIWIPGYWAWSERYGIFLWVSGVWRRPPPGHEWNAGYWKNYPQGWVWVHGFWKSVDQQKALALTLFPPDPVDERVPPPPAVDGYFWVPGGWQYDVGLKNFVWLSGRWEAIDLHWVYTPAHYVWRENSYVFVSGFWDWPLNVRGTPFSPILVAHEAIPTIVYEPTEELARLFVIEQLFPEWPSYSCQMRTNYYYNADAWGAWGAAPSWWNWQAWWCFPSAAQWGLWWWWSHPGYPSPSWLGATDAQAITPPPQFVVRLMQNVNPPAIITPHGVVGEYQLFKALNTFTGHTLPILPANSKELLQIQAIANPQAPSQPYLEPSALGQPLQAPAKPFFGPARQELKTPPRRVIIPPKPVIASETPVTPPPSPPKRKSQTTAYSSAPIVPRPYTPPPQVPYQGYMITEPYPQAPMQTQHLNRIMGSPQPQRNPTDPNVYPVPGDQSTLPGL